MGAATGGIGGALMWIGARESSARRYQSQVLEGNILVSVECASRADLERGWQAMADAGGRRLVRLTAPALPPFRPATGLLPTR